MSDAKITNLDCIGLERTVCFCEQEYNEFIDHRASRPKIIYKVSIDKLMEVSPLKNYIGR